MVEHIFCGIVQDKSFQAFRLSSPYWYECRDKFILMLKGNQPIKTKYTFNQITFCIHITDRLKHLHP